MRKLYIIFLFVHLSIHSCYSQDTDVVWNEFDKIDSVEVAEGLNSFDVLVYCNSIDSISNPWAKITAEVCLHELQQINSIPYESEKSLSILLLYPKKNDSIIALHTFPKIRPMNLGLNSTYYFLCKNSINIFNPSEIKYFEESVNNFVLVGIDFKYQAFLLALSGIRLNSRNTDVQRQVELISEYFDDSSKEGSRVAEFLVDFFYQLNEMKELEME